MQKITLCLKLIEICRLYYRLQGLEVCEVILGVQSSVTKRDEGEGRLFFPKIA